MHTKAFELFHTLAVSRYTIHVVEKGGALWLVIELYRGVLYFRQRPNLHLFFPWAVIVEY